MISKLVTDYLRDLAERLQMVAPIGVGVDTGDVRQLIDLADTLDEERKEELAAVKESLRDTAS